MKLCRVKGTVVATVKHPTYIGQKLMVVQALDERGAPQGTSFLAVDRVQAGVGDLVLVNAEGNASRQLFKIDRLPIRSLILGIVDRVDCDSAACDSAVRQVVDRGEQASEKAPGKRGRGRSARSAR